MSTIRTLDYYCRQGWYWAWLPALDSSRVLPSTTLRRCSRGGCVHRSIEHGCQCRDRGFPKAYPWNFHTKTARLPSSNCSPKRHVSAWWTAFVDSQPVNFAASQTWAAYHSATTASWMWMGKYHSKLSASGSHSVGTHSSRLASTSRLWSRYCRSRFDSWKICPSTQHNTTQHHRESVPSHDSSNRCCRYLAGSVLLGNTTKLCSSLWSWSLA